MTTMPPARSFWRRFDAKRLGPWTRGAVVLICCGLLGGLLVRGRQAVEPAPLAAVPIEPARLVRLPDEEGSVPRLISLPSTARPVNYQETTIDGEISTSAAASPAVDLSMPLLPPLDVQDESVEVSPVDLSEIEPDPVEATTPLTPSRETKAFQSPPALAQQPPPLAQQAVELAPLAVEPARPRTTELEAVARRCDEQIRRGFSLANKRAFYSAQREFIESLRTLAQALDAQHGTIVRDKALTAGLRALTESDDLYAAQARGHEALDIEQLTAGHVTPALDGVEPASLSLVAVIQLYYTYAQEQFAAAVDHEVAGSMALYGLGKMHVEFAQERPAVVFGAEAKAVVFHQAALTVDQRNALAANELGVVLARFGRLSDARSALWHSLMTAPTPAAWHNLSVVHQQLGEVELARLADRESAALAGRQRSGSIRSRISAQWVEPLEFARATPAADGTIVDGAAVERSANKDTKGQR